MHLDQNPQIKSSNPLNDFHRGLPTRGTGPGGACAHQPTGLHIEATLFYNAFGHNLPLVEVNGCPVYVIGLGVTVDLVDAKQPGRAIEFDYVVLQTAGLIGEGPLGKP